MQKLSPAFVDLLEKILRGRRPNEVEKQLIRDFLEKNKNGNLQREDLHEFIKTFFRLAPLLQQFLE